MAAEKNNYQVRPVSGDNPFNVKGTRLVAEDSGYVSIFDGDELVARVINSNVVKLEA